MITGPLIDLVYDAAKMQRWNDHIRPVEFTELDKQAHKMIIAYVLAKFEEDKGRLVDWTLLVEAGIFEFLYRIIVTDIKPPVFHKIRRTKGRELNAHVFGKLDPLIGELPGGFKERFHAWFEEGGDGLERQVLTAAHYLATEWEFKIIYNTCSYIYGIERTKEAIENQIEEHYHLLGVQKLHLRKKTYGFVDLCGQLRFQQRWSQTPRLPKTSVLGHMLIVAVLSHLLFLGVPQCPRRRYNNFFGSLFHDLPEVMTRDIISPVKTGIEGLEELLKEVEEEQLESELLPLLPSRWREEVRWFVLGEFENKVRDGGRTLAVPEEDMAAWDEDRHDPKDGCITKYCDQLAAFVEAALSIRTGVTSPALTSGIASIYGKYADRTVHGLRFRHLFDHFKP